jgi:hypothetical protein
VVEDKQMDSLRVDAPNPFPGRDLVDWSVLVESGESRSLIDAPLLEVRQISGLTAGAVFPLGPGPLRLGMRPRTVGFELIPKDQGQVVVVPHASTVRLDGVILDEPAVVGDGVIDVGSARFAIARRRPPGGGRRLAMRHEAPASDPVIPVPEPGTHFTDELVKRVSAARRVVVAQRRRRHPNPVEIIAAATADDGLRWIIRSDAPSFGQVGIAHADLPWRPRFDRPGRIDTRSATALEPLTSLSGVTVTADLCAGPLAVIGSRQARLAVARQIAIALSTLTSPDDLELAVLAPGRHSSAWSWADLLPHTAGGLDHAVPVLFVDGPGQLDNDLGTALSQSPGIGAVLLADHASEITTPVAMTMIIADDFTATIVDHRSGRTQVAATPLGLTEDAAASAAAALHAAALDRRHGQKVGGITVGRF